MRSGIIHPDTGKIVNVIIADAGQTVDGVTGYALTNLPCEKGDTLVNGSIVPKPVVPIPLTARDIRAATFKADPIRVNIADKLKIATPAEISAWVEAQVTDLNSAKTMFKRILLLIATDTRL